MSFDPQYFEAGLMRLENEALNSCQTVVVAPSHLALRTRHGSFDDFEGKPQYY